MEWGSSAVIGFNAAGNYFENHNSSGVPTVSGIACLALPEQVNNLVYDLDRTRAKELSVFFTA